MLLRIFPTATLLFVCLLANTIYGSDDLAGPDEVEAGHSYHGEAFNEGPRQAGQILAGMPKITFPTSTKSGSAQQFFEQGIAQLHGFWYLESERSFRQAASEDPAMAIAYWGMAMANINNQKRARGFIDEAMKLRNSDTSKREKLYIEALDRMTEKVFDDEDKRSKDEKKEAKQNRTERYLSDLEEILHQYPDDIEAKAFLVLSLWLGDRDGVKLTSRLAVDALLRQIVDANPMHPAHHYGIHLWDSKHPDNALESAAKCGPSSPGIAHMWHMPGHIYSKLKRYNDAAWQQEASARVDHSHMIQSHLMPDQIHNFAHNNEWLVRNLLFVGRVDDALDLSRNLISLPRHPKYNTMSKGGSAKFGRERLIQTLTQYELWDELLHESGGDYLVPTDNATFQEDWMGWSAVAQFKAKLGKPAEGARTLRALQRRRLALQGQLLDLAEQKTKKNENTTTEEQEDTPELPSRDKIKKHIAELTKIIARVSAASASRHKDAAAFKRSAKNAKLDPVLEARWLARTGEHDDAIKLVRKAVKDSPSQVRPLAVLVDLLWESGKQEEATKEFETLRSVAAVADIDTPILARLGPVAAHAKIDGDWRITSKPAADLGDRPPLDQLGPFRWHPYQAESWGAKRADGTLVAGDEFDGKPRILVFYLGFGCLHCMEQLHAMEPKTQEFKDLGIELVAISSETVEELKTGQDNFEAKMSIPLLSDAKQHVFKSFGCWDDFESQPLHGTFLIDAAGNVRWQDIGYEPFMDIDFLVNESKRLLELK
ncbi:peroxiredoxin family protein [Rubripirellula reticaptiva]|uniref:Selenocysteine-containing peroxiredoxin PrxU n=1 Tax=Rubripirellula reticaptiva TaxID=2528013 RepID=A0A5C6EL69_9BACT|nr:peroxiredoxin family protein [Rubripirellula reticaptiva]TWU49204.1 Selenocysteine-containing peroxiredoxin PrxU [Rubripirellula reticaptiva]